MLRGCAVLCVRVSSVPVHVCVSQVWSARAHVTGVRGDGGPRKTAAEMVVPNFDSRRFSEDRGSGEGGRRK